MGEGGGGHSSRGVTAQVWGRNGWKVGPGGVLRGRYGWGGGGGGGYGGQCEGVEGFMPSTNLMWVGPIKPHACIGPE